MRKLTLRLDDLAVESFSPAAAHIARGTAHAHAFAPVAETLPLPPDTGGSDPGNTQVDCLTCEASCGTRGCE